MVHVLQVLRLHSLRSCIMIVALLACVCMCERSCIMIVALLACVCMCVHVWACVCVSTFLSIYLFQCQQAYHRLLTHVYQSGILVYTYDDKQTQVGTGVTCTAWQPLCTYMCKPHAYVQMDARIGAARVYIQTRRDRHRRTCIHMLGALSTHSNRRVCLLLWVSQYYSMSVVYPSRVCGTYMRAYIHATCVHTHTHIVHSYRTCMHVQIWAPGLLLPCWRHRL